MEKRFADLIESRLSALETNAYAVEKANGLPADAIRNVMRSTKKSGPTLSRVEQICAALGLEIYIGPKRHGAVDTIRVADQEFASIPVHRAEASVGPGTANFDGDPLGEIAFQRSWLSQIGVSPGQAGIIRVRGDSMEPTIRCGSIALIDESRTDAKGGIFAFVQDGDLRIKRLDRPDAKVLVVVSDNAAYPPEIRMGHDMNEIRVLGEVVWTAYNWRDDPKLRISI